MEQPNKIELEVEKSQQIFNYRLNGTSLIYDPDNVPEPEPTPPTELNFTKAKCGINEASFSRIKLFNKHKE